MSPPPSLRALFDALLPLPPAQRERRLSDPSLPAALVAELRELLAHAPTETAAGFLAEPAALPEAQDLRPADRQGQRLGAWQLLALLGSGGMGEVWLARRADGAFDGQAAVKLLKRGMDSDAVLARFAQEQRALARLSHPHIARLLDAGRSPDGLPYFVMERVQGRPLDEAAAALPLRERLALFLQLADAVAHAHRHLLVHRDLKPGNVLVDEEGRVKLLDFGIAKALALHGEDAGNPQPATQGGTQATTLLAFTPHFASPEQVRGEPVSTATDQYSLGVLLYLLLTGQRPYGHDADSALAAAQAVLEQEPRRPSAVVADAALRRALAGDLDNVVLKALEKAPERRYPSVETLAADLRAHLAGFPVSAQAPSAGYRLRKFVGRNRAAVAAGAVAALALLGGTALALWQAGLAERRFAEAHRFARTMLFDVDSALRDGPTAGREVLVSQAAQYLGRLSGERIRDTALLRDLAEAWERVADIQGSAHRSNVGRPQDADTSLAQALALRERLAARDGDDLDNVAGLMTVRERLGDHARAQGDLARAADHYRQAVAQARVLAERRGDDLKAQLALLRTQRYLASAHYWPNLPSLGDHATARALLQEQVQRLDELLRRFPGHTDVASSGNGLLNQWTDMLRLAGEHAAALANAQRSMALVQQLLAAEPAHPVWQRWQALTEGRLADALIDAGHWDEGVALWQRSIAGREAVVQADPGNERALRTLANGYGPLAEHHLRAGRLLEALPWLERENQLLHQMRQRFPQVAALGPRWVESERDLAMTLALAQPARAAEGVSRLQALGAAPAAIADDSTALAKLRLARARALLPRLGAGQADQREALWREALQTLATLREAARREAFNATAALEAAQAAVHLGRAGEDCTLLRQGAQALQALAGDGRLPRPLQGLVTAAAADAAACSS